MNEVTTRATEPFLAEAIRRGVAPERLVEGLDVDLATLRAWDRRIDWDTFAAFCERVHAHIGPEGVVAAGESVVRGMAWRPVMIVARMLAHPIDVYRYANDTVGPLFYRIVGAEMVERPDGALELTLTIPPGYADSPAFFLACLGTLRTNPRLCGQPDAVVELTLGPRKAVYVIRLAADVPRSVVGRVRDAFARVLAAPIAEEAWERQAVQLREADEARRLAERQFLLAQKTEGLGLLAGGVAHDINNLLASILGNAELVLDRLPPGGIDRERILRIIRAVDRASDLTGRLLDYAGRRPPRIVPVDISALVREMGELARTAVPRTFELHLELATDLPPIAGDPAQLQQVALNLVTNAAAAVAPTSGRVTLRTGFEDVTPARLVTALHRGDAQPGPHVYVEVEDDGVGMDEATRARIFDPFFTTRPDGRGLGLAAVLGVTRAHDGFVDVASAPGRGSRFRVCLPVTDTTGLPLLGSTGEEEAWRLDATVLVVDDDDEVRGALGALLATHGLRVLAAGDHAGAVSLAAAHAAEIDVILLDRTMPGRAGEEAFHALRAAAPSARIVLCSGVHDMDGLAALEASGLAGVLQKPFHRAELGALLRRLVP